MDRVFVKSLFSITFVMGPGYLIFSDRRSVSLFIWSDRRFFRKSDSHFKHTSVQYLLTLRKFWWLNRIWNSKLLSAIIYSHEVRLCQRPVRGFQNFVYRFHNTKFVSKIKVFPKLWLFLSFLYSREIVSLLWQSRFNPYICLQWSEVGHRAASDVPKFLMRVRVSTYIPSVSTKLWNEVSTISNL